MIEASLTARSRSFEQRMLGHATKLVAAQLERQRIGNDRAWRDPRLLWPTFSQR